MFLYKSVEVLTLAILYRCLITSCGWEKLKIADTDFFNSAEKEQDSSTSASETGVYLFVFISRSSRSQMFKETPTQVLSY